MLKHALALASLTALPHFARATDESDDSKTAFFEKKVRPVLVGHCYQCHSAETKPAGGLRVDDRHGLLMGGDNGAAVVPGDVTESLLIQRIETENAKRHMPKEGDPINETELADLKTWITDGAAWPRERVPAYLTRNRAEYDELKATHWAFQPLQSPAAPAVKDAAWPRSEPDRFILAALEARQLAPGHDADRATLLRRITFDLTGLPPSAREIGAFIDDPSPDAFERTVDRLLASPRFGERWGRHWLDLARFGESTGPSRNVPYPHAWKYRDYVLDAINRDVPFDRFVQEQIAGDLLPSENNAERDRLATATGFLALGVKDVNQRFKTRFIMDNVDEQIDTVSRSVLGLTVSCARCHDHKFDPIPARDYYALAGIFTSTDNCSGLRNKMGGSGLAYYDSAMLVRLATADAAPAVPEEQLAALKKQVEEARLAFEEIRGTPEGLAKDADGKPKQRGLRVKFEKLQNDLQQLTDPAQHAEVVHGVRDGKTIADTDIRIRGEAERLGPTVPRGFLSAVAVPNAPAIPADQSGRLQLAQWLTDPQNPLTARVYVNRVWQHLFGSGLVSTVDNFGIKGASPSHPELLDFLAAQFIRDGWSTKRLVRALILSHTYQLSSEASAAHREKDPDNRLLWRHSPRRLESEEIRDTVLAVTGRLELTPPPSTPERTLRMSEIRDNGPEARGVQEHADKALYRSVYLPLLRGLTPRALEPFDPVSQTLVTGRRDETTVPTQALFLLNSAFIREQALAFAEQLAADPDRFDAERIREIFVRSLGRGPSDRETVRAEQFLANLAASWRQSTRPGPAQAARNPASAETVAQEKEPENPDDVDRSEKAAIEAPIEAADARTAAWMALVQSLLATAEFRYVR